MKALFRATISFEDISAEGETWRHMPVGPEGQFWWDPVRSCLDVRGGSKPSSLLLEL